MGKKRENVSEKTLLAFGDSVKHYYVSRISVIVLKILSAHTHYSNANTSNEPLNQPLNLIKTRLCYCLYCTAHVVN